MIFLLFCVPLAVYLLVLGWVNRQPRPVVVSGVWDFVGLLFAASGFLLFGGPAVLSATHERWRYFWLFGEGGRSALSLEPLRQAWVLFAALYFVLVVAGSAVVLARRRRVTCVYNADPETVERALAASCDRLGLTPVRSGNLFVFGLVLDVLDRKPAASHPGLQGPHAHQAKVLPEADPPAGDELTGQQAILEVESFPATSHVSLWWEPADAPLRAAVEAELTDRLHRTSTPDHSTSAWLNLAASFLLLLSLVILVLLTLRPLLQR
ncbi:MAG: hypothetical protein U0736_03360 [Gemmataceae bacterium]